MGSPKFEIGGMSFPIAKKTNFSFEVMPTMSGGMLVRHRGKAVVDVLRGPGVAKSAKKIRIDLRHCLGRGKKIILQQDLVRVGDQIFKLAAPKRRRASAKSTAKRPRSK